MADLIFFTCINPKCNHPLLWAPETSSVQCNKCHRWTKAEDITNNNPARMSDNDQPEQLTMFV